MKIKIRTKPNGSNSNWLEIGKFKNGKWVTDARRYPQNDPRLRVERVFQGNYGKADQRIEWTIEVPKGYPLAIGVRSVPGDPSEMLYRPMPMGHGSKFCSHVVRDRTVFEKIQSCGMILPRAESNERGWSFKEDVIAGDDGNVFLWSGKKYLDSGKWGWVFDSNQLIGLGAKVGPDLYEDFDEIIFDVCSEFSRELPPGELATDEEIKPYLEDLGPQAAETLRNASVDRTEDLRNAVLGYDPDTFVPPALILRARKEIKTRCNKIRNAKRVGGNTAKNFIETSEGFEVVFNGRLLLDLAVGVIEDGIMRSFQV